MSEKVVRIRTTPGGWDEYQDPIPSTETREPLHARAVAPGASQQHQALGRNGQTVEFTVYFVGRTDLTDDDRLEIRGSTYDIRCLDWRSAYGTGRRGLVVLATRQEG